MISTGIPRSCATPTASRPTPRWRFSPMGNPLCCASTVPKAPVYSAARFRPTQFCCMGSTFARPAARRWGNKVLIKSLLHFAFVENIADSSKNNFTVIK